MKEIGSLQKQPPHKNINFERDRFKPQNMITTTIINNFMATFC